MSEHAQAIQARLAATERRLELALAASRMGVWEWDLATNQVVWSPECLTIVGVSDFDGSLDGFLRCVHPDDVSPLMAAAEAAAAGHAELRHEFRIIHPDGTIAWLANVGRAVYDPADRAVKFLGTVRDITAERAERSAAQQAATFRQFADRLPYCVWTSGPDGVADFINLAALEYHGLRLEELRGRLGERVHPDDRAAFRRERTRGLAEQTPWGLRARFQRHDGVYRWFEVQATPVRDAEGQLLQWIGTLKDVDAEMQLSGQVRQEQRRLDAITATSPGVICSFRMAPDGRMSMPYASPGFLDLYGLRTEEVLADASPIFSRTHPADRPFLEASIVASARAMTPWQDEWRYNHPTRGEIWIEGHSAPLPEPDGGIVWHGVVTDVTSRKRMERQLRMRSDVIEDSPIGYAIISREAQFIYVNPAFARMWGYERPEDLLGTTPVALCMDAAVPGQCIASVDAKGSCISEFTARRQDGSTFEVRMQLTSSVAEDGGRIYVGSAVDITEERRAQATIRQWADAFEHTGYGIAMALPGSDTLMACNPAFAQLVGRAVDEVTGIRIAELYPPEDRTRIRNCLEESDRSGSAHHESRLVRPDGSGIDVHVDVVSVRGDDGTLLYRVATVQDITERKLASESLRSTRDHLQAVDRASPLPIVALTPDGTVLHWNHAAEELFGWTAEEVLGKPLPIVPEDKVEEYEQFRRKVISGRGFSEVSERVNRQGRRIAVRISTSALHDVAGTHIGLVAVYVDLTEQRALESALRASEERFSIAFEASPVASLLLRASDRVIVEVNAAMVALTGFGREELIGRTSAEVPGLVATEDREAGWNRIEATGLLVPTDQRIGCKDGSRRQVTASAKRITIGGEPMVLSTLVDITERTRAEAALRESENRLRLFIDHAPAALAMFDREMRYLAASREWFADHRMPEQDLRGRLHYDVFHDIPERWRDIHRRALAGEVLRCEADRVERADGTVQWFRWEVRPWHLASGEVGGILIFSDDISGSVAAQQALSDSEARFRQLAESIHEVFWLTDLAKGTIIYLSPGYEAVWGRSCDSVYENPRAWLDAIHPDDRERVLEAALTRQADGSYDEEYRVVRPDGSVRWVRDQAFPVRNEEGEVIRIAGVAEDITERRQLETQFHHTQKMESIGLLAGGVAHDFNNWLTVIAGCTELLQEDLSENEDASDLLNEIRHASERATGLTRQLLAFSRREVVEPRVQDLNGIIRDTEKMLHRLLGEDVLLETALSPGLSPVRVDAGQWTQVLMNLAVNARDAMPRGGRLTMESHEATLDAEFTRTHPNLVPGRYVILSISDTGAGMTPEIRARIFEPFFTTKTQHRGTGLGLAVVHGIVTQNGGAIDVYSEPGVGTTFRIYIPVSDAVASDAAPSAGTGEIRGTETVMVVEDEESIRRMTTHALRGQGYTVLQAGDGEEALAVLHRYGGPVDLLVTDVVMPRMGGRAVAEVMKGMFPTLKILYTSGYTDDAVVRHGILQSEVAFLSKPYTPMTLLRRMRQVLDTP